MERKFTTPFGRMLALSVMAGAFIALAAVGSIVATDACGDAGRLASACVFPAGLMMVVLTEGELFTGNCLWAAMAACGRVRWVWIIRILLISYVGNLVGGLAIALAVAHCGLTDVYMDTIVTTASAKCALTFGDAFIRGVLCNVLVCVAVWMASSAKDTSSKIAAVFFPVMLFVLCGFEHSVADFCFLGLSVFSDGATWARFWHVLIPVTFGNLVGGAAIGIIRKI